MNKYFSDGVTTSDGDSLKADIARKLIDKKSDMMLVGKNAVMMENTAQLDIKLDIPELAYFPEETVAEGASAGFQNLDFFKVNQSMVKKEVGFNITYETKARGMEAFQTRMSIDRCSKGLSIGKDTEIFGTLSTGAGGSTAAADTWDGSSADPATDIANAIGKIMDNTEITDEEAKNIGVYYPANMWSQLAKPTEVNNIILSLRNWAEKEYHVSFYATRRLTTDALVTAASMDSAIHLNYVGTDIPLTIHKVDAEAERYLFKNYYKTFIIPEVEGGTTTSYIQKVTGVSS